MSTTIIEAHYGILTVAIKRTWYGGYMTVDHIDGESEHVLKIGTLAECHRMYSYYKETDHYGDKE